MLNRFVATGAVLALGLIGLLPAASADAAPANPVSSPNWSGYVIQADAAFRSVTGTWTVPAITCAGTKTQAAVWVGLDGYTDETVEQTGVKIVCQGDNAAFQAWWQMWPAPAHFLSVSRYPVSPGDVVTASVTRQHDDYRVEIRNGTQWSFSTSQVVGADDSSAEWIVSTPPLCRGCSFASLADFGSLHFTAARAATGGRAKAISSWTANGGPHSLSIQRDGTTLASPGPLAPGGAKFSVRWRAAS